MRARRAAARWVMVALSAALLVGGYSSAASAAGKPAPAGTRPSKAAKMVCRHEAQEDIAGVLGAKPTRVTTPTWADHLYSCTYVYPTGSFTLSVKELSGRPTTTTYFDGLAATLGRRPEAFPLGQGAFLTTDGSAVVRKDYKVLEVDVSQLPAQFGKLALVPADVSASVASTVLGCWSGG